MRRYQKYLLVMTGAVLFAYAGAAGTAVYGQTDGRLAGQAVDGINGKEETGPGIGLKDINTEESAEEQELMGNIPAASETDSLIDHEASQFNPYFRLFHALFYAC